MLMSLLKIPAVIFILSLVLFRPLNVNGQTDTPAISPTSGEPTVTATVAPAQASNTPGAPTNTSAPTRAVTPTVRRSPTPAASPTDSPTPTPLPTATPTPTPTPQPNFIQRAGGPLGFVLIILGIILLGVTFYLHKKRLKTS